MEENLGSIFQSRSAHTPLHLVRTWADLPRVAELLGEVGGGREGTIIGEMIETIIAGGVQVPTGGGVPLHITGGVSSEAGAGVTHQEEGIILLGDIKNKERCG